MFQKIAKHRANDASNDVHRPPLSVSRRSCYFLSFLEINKYRSGDTRDVGRDGADD